MKRLIISGSPRARGRSAGVAEAVRFAFEESCADDDVQLVSLADVRISPCTGCETCADTLGRNELYCIISDDMLRVREMLNACDQLTVVSPVYFAGAPSQLKAFLDRLQPYFYANWRAKPKRPASLYVVGEGGDPHGFGPLVGEARSALAVAGFALESVHDWVGLVSADGALPSGSDVLEGGRVHPASAYTWKRTGFRPSTRSARTSSSTTPSCRKSSPWPILCPTITCWRWGRASARSPSRC